MKKMNKKFALISICFILMVVIAGAVFASPDILDLIAYKGNDGLAQSEEISYDGIGISVYAKNLNNNGKNVHSKTKDVVKEDKKAETTDSTETESAESDDSTTSNILSSRGSTTTSTTTSTSSDSTSSTTSTTTSTSSDSNSSTSSSSSTTESTQQASEPDSEPAQVEEPAQEPVQEPVEETKPDTVAGAFYVSKSGNDANPGTESQPWKTIQKAASTLKAGQTVYVKEGTYNERVTLKNSGTSGNYITFTNYPGDRVIVDGAGIDWGYNWQCLFNTNGKDYIKVNGFRVINSRWAGIGSEDDYDSGNHVIISNNSTYNTKASGIAFYNASNITVEGNSVEKACTAQGSQEAISISNVNTFTIRNNKVFNITNSVQGAGGEGIDAKNGSSNGKIYNNTVHDIVKIGIYVDAYKATSSNIQVYGNSVYNCGEGITVATEKGGLLKNVNIYSNSIRNCATGFSIAGWENGYSHDMDTIKFNSNTISGATSRGIYLNNPDARNVYITNNNISGTSSMIPIHLNGGLLSETTIDGNVFDREIDLALAGTNYTFN